MIRPYDLPSLKDSSSIPKREMFSWIISTSSLMIVLNWKILAVSSSTSISSNAPRASCFGSIIRPSALSSFSFASRSSRESTSATFPASGTGRVARRSFSYS